MAADWTNDTRLYPYRVADRPQLGADGKHDLVALDATGSPIPGCPVKYTKPEHRNVLRLVSQGVKPHHAAMAGGLSERTFRRWLEKGETICELLERGSMPLNGEMEPTPFPTGMMLCYYHLYLDVRQAQAMAVIDATAQVRKHVTGYVIQGEWVQDQEEILYEPPAYKNADGPCSADAPGAVLVSGDPGYDPEDPYKAKAVVRKRRWIPAKRVEGNSGMAWSMLQRLDPDPVKPTAAVSVSVDARTTVDARKVQVYGHDLSSLALEQLRALGDGDAEELGELLGG